MAVWTVNTTADDGSVDTLTNTGSLRGIIDAAASGDTIVFDDALEDTDGVVTIYLEWQLSIPAKNLTIDGGGHTGNGETLATRVILDGQNATSALHTNNSSNVILNDITIYNTTRTSGAGSAIRANAGGQVYTLNYCIVDTTDRAALYLLSATDTTFNNCVFKNCKNKERCGVLYTFGSPTITFNNCVFRDNESSSTGGATAYIYGTGTAAFNSCDVGATVSNWNIYVNSNCLLIFNNTNVIDKVRFVSNAGLEGTLTADVLSIANSSTITFSGVDSILAVTTTATIGSATFTAAENSTGYLALPDGTTPPTVGTGVKTATYGAGIESVSYRYPNLNYTATNISIPVLFESRATANDAWTTVGYEDSSPIHYPNNGQSFLARLFDGEAFYDVSFGGITPRKELTAYTTTGYLTTKNSIGYLN